MKSAMTFVKNHMTGITTSKEELLKEILHFKAFWPPSADCYTDHNCVLIKVFELTEQDREYIEERIKPYK